MFVVLLNGHPLMVRLTEEKAIVSASQIRRRLQLREARFPACCQLTHELSIEEVEYIE